MRVLSEHSSVPNTTYNDVLIYEAAGEPLNEMLKINESTTENGLKVVKFRGKFQEADAINKNKRSYPFKVLDDNVKRLQESIDAGGLLGECDHPLDSVVHFANVSHKITKLWWEGKTLLGEGILLNTPSGKIMKAILESCRVGLSSRGVGSGKVNESGILVIEPSYRLITFDFVADPSTYNAYQERVSGKNEQTEINNNSTNKNNLNNILKNENSGIYKLNKDVLLACFGSMVKKATDKAKANI